MWECKTFGGLDKLLVVMIMQISLFCKKAGKDLYRCLLAEADFLLNAIYSIIRILLRRLERVFWPREEWFPMYMRGNYPRKSRAISRVITCVTNMAPSGSIKMSGPCSVSDESVLHSTKNGKFTTTKQSEKSLSSTKLAKKGRKRLSEERKEEGEVDSPVSRKARRLRSVCHILFYRTFKWKLPSIWLC